MGICVLGLWRCFANYASALHWAATCTWLLLNLQGNVSIKNYSHAQKNGRSTNIAAKKNRSCKFYSNNMYFISINWLFQSIVFFTQVLLIKSINFKQVSSGNALVLLTENAWFGICCSLYSYHMQCYHCHWNGAWLAVLYQELLISLSFLLKNCRKIV